MRFKPSLVALATASVLGFSTISSAAAAIIKGQVKDSNNDPVAGAIIKVEGLSRTATTDADGNYVLDFSDQESESHIHLHVYSPSHLHGDNDLGFISQDQTIDFTLISVTFENVVVTANALETSVLESITPVTVLGEEELRKRQAATLGETLKMVPGVHSTYFAGVAASPIIRGNDGPRVKVIQNGLDVSDVSRVGPDHAVATDTSSATQVEVLRGPATLQYGSGAIGGVVNVVDNRIPSSVPSETEGEAEVRYGSVNEEQFAKFNLTTGTGNWAFHLDAFSRESEDIDIPGFAELVPDEGEEPGVIEGSAVDTDNIVGGLSYVGESGYLGFSVQQMNNFYGVPGHAHGHGDEHGHDDHDDEMAGEEAEEMVNIDAALDRYQLSGKWYSPIDGITSIDLNAAYSEYEHVELENGEVGTRFANDTLESRVDIIHEDIAGWHGVVGLQYVNSDYVADGEEAFSPPSETDSFALFVIEEKRIEDVTLQFGARLERTEYSADDISIGLELGEHHDEEDHDDDHDGDHDDHDHDDHEGEHDGEEMQDFSFDDYAFTSFSASFGANWHYAEGKSLALSVSRSERAPSSQELFSGGAHLAVSTYELGLLFDLDEDGELSDQLRSPSEETSNNIDITWRHFHGAWGLSASVFYSDIDDYIYQRDTGFVFADEHDDHGDDHDDDHGDEHDDEHGDEHDDEHGDEHGDEHEDEGFPVLAFQQSDATLYGFEFDGHYDINQKFRVSLFGDYIRAKIDGGDLPRIPPLRLGSSLRYQWQGWDADVEAIWYDDQDKTADFEEATDGYTLVNLGVNYTTQMADMEWQLFMRADNVFDEDARVHTSFLKDDAPLPGRNIQLGIRAYF